MMDLTEVLAREAIRDLVVRYNSTSDSGRFDELFALFAPDAVMETGERGDVLRSFVGLESITTIFTGVRQHMQGQAEPASMRYIRHFTTTHQIDVIDDNQAKGRVYFAVLLPHGLDHWGRYVDGYVRIAGEWRFARRVVTVDGRSPASQFDP